MFLDLQYPMFNMMIEMSLRFDTTKTSCFVMNPH